MIEFNQVSMQRGTQMLLKDASLRIHDGQKLALIGPNGAGKSSLFALLNGELGVDGGDLYIPSKWRIAHMKQEVEASERSAVDYAMDGDSVYRQIEAGIANAQSDNELADWLDKMDQHQGYQVPVKAEQLLHGLGFSKDELKRPVKSFSGGWRIRLNLAQALMMPSDLMLLDEPTNHLDLEATMWLEQYLKNYPGTLLFISHDRDFIDGVADHIVHLHNQSLTQYPGNYSAYERIRAEKLAQQQSVYEKQQERVAEIEKFVTRFKAKASKAKQAQSRLKELQRMELIAPAHVDSPFRFEFPCYEKMSTPLLAIDHAALGYDDKTILPDVKLSIVPGHRVGLLGPNGAGKSTLLKTLCNEISMVSGERSEGEHLRIGYYAQHQLESLDVKATGLLILQRLKPKASEQEIRNFLGGFGFHGDRALEVIEPFSGGEKARLALACVAWMKPNLLILDEPTNHLDIEMREALTLALQNFPGAILVVSHDRHLLKATVDEYWLVDNSRVQEFDGDLDDYHQYLNQRDTESAAPAGSTASAKEDKPVIDRKEQKRLEAERRQRLAPLRKKQQAAEKEMEKLQSQLSGIEEKLSDAGLYDADRKNELNDLLLQQGKVKSALEDIEMEWMELTEQLEDAE
ncbi:MAG: ABC transporter ATP-binding protein [Oceanospirillaceae bacterium]|uniref:ATP-binding cassette domain-containing protein n=1 Tax=unclassified Thalassolituus TaxID=2624967 RepID=UPI000C56FFC1|nr:MULTISPECIES: ATP-binding cassette domain-containing protein [unclassified Thalassolituus]MAS24314.1 ABC transporter ATP-binding protein [Oceanospirillaceae bacterium]MAX99284.1 ABC transporter ATP-binding protein [Oceanospirillaceae bacterium]MBL33381.1 ABC transporter ATP-binding protein [Oceanospirillaceae bacterium]MBS51258.1 ABC transporter ATP-binding protein [Oceanospirillaceae bacterium]MBS55020.1 ABC transporter ATP-binding protein [Oceanospirillaceae bacterium]|tara:strand:- start:11566 stop:13458 length:1893 start_codon:yes stop_codon:yes gene_type:complete